MPRCARGDFSRKICDARGARLLNFQRGRNVDENRYPVLSTEPIWINHPNVRTGRSKERASTVGARAIGFASLVAHDRGGHPPKSSARLLVASKRGGSLDHPLVSALRLGVVGTPRLLSRETFTALLSVSPPSELPHGGGLDPRRAICSALSRALDPPDGRIQWQEGWSRPRATSLH
jgi:hypothetical protein